MIRSGAEIRAEVLKAARGAGLPLGVAEDVADWSAVLSPEDLARLAALIAAPDRHGTLIDACVEEDMTGRNALFPDRADHVAAREVPEETWHRFSTLAARTYVPESDASRASGAGAGNIDND